MTKYDSGEPLFGLFKAVCVSYVIVVLLLYLFFQSRFVAGQSQQLRDELKERYGGESFDKKVLRAELYNKLGLGSRPSQKTKSKKQS